MVIIIQEPEILVNRRLEHNIDNPFAVKGLYREAQTGSYAT